MAEAAEPSNRIEAAGIGSRQPVVVAITGASGAAYAMRLLDLLNRLGRPIELVASPAGIEVLRLETDVVLDVQRFESEAFLAQARSFLARLTSGGAGYQTSSGAAACTQPARPPDEPGPNPSHSALRCHHYLDWSAGIASGSYLTAGMVVCPCSMGTLGAIAAGSGSNLIHRAADVHLKERRPLILVPRETPLNLLHIKNMARCTRAGAVILPAMPGWYHRPRSLLDQLDFIAARILDQLGIAHSFLTRWGNAGRR